MTVAITAALQVLGFFELPDDEVPDENIWHHASRLEEWFEAIKQRRESGLQQPIDQVEDADMTGNQLARDLLGED